VGGGTTQLVGQQQRRVLVAQFGDGQLPERAVGYGGRLNYLGPVGAGRVAEAAWPARNSRHLRTVSNSSSFGLSSK
jgi:hypothetical protein